MDDIQSSQQKKGEINMFYANMLADAIHELRCIRNQLTGLQNQQEQLIYAMNHWSEIRREERG